MRISVIIPTLNEEKYILKTIESALNFEKSKPEIIVVDAGSTDTTIDLLKKLNDVKFISKKNLKGLKYASLNCGASMASGDVLLFLDADTRLPDNYDKLIIHALDSDHQAGAFNLKFENSGVLLKIIEILNSIRYRITKRFFGDQAIFCTREVFESVGGFPEIKIMEAAHLCRNLKRRTRLKLLAESVLTSDRRFGSQGVLKVFLTDLKILTMDILALNTKKEGEKYWAKVNR